MYQKSGGRGNENYESGITNYGTGLFKEDLDLRLNVRGQ